MQSPFALDGQDDLRMDLELAEAMGQCSTAGHDVDDPDMPAFEERPRPSSACSDEKADTHDQPPRPHSTPPTLNQACTGIVSDMISNIFRNVLVSIETNDVALGLDGLALSVGNPRPVGRSLRPTASSHPSRPAAAVRKSRVSASAHKRSSITLRARMRQPLSRGQPVLDEVRELRPPATFAPLAIRPTAIGRVPSDSASDRSVTSP